MDENSVIAAVCHHLEQSGYHVRQRLHTTQQGVDIIAWQEESGHTLYIEAKGSTSSMKSSSSFGEPNNQKKVQHQVAFGVFTTLRLRALYPNWDTERVALAVPEGRWFRHYLEPLTAQLQTLGIIVFLVAEDGSVKEL